MKEGVLEVTYVRNGSDLVSITKESITRQLKAKGLKLTPQRLTIIEVLIEKRGSSSRRAFCV